MRRTRSENRFLLRLSQKNNGPSVGTQRVVENPSRIMGKLVELFRPTVQLIDLLPFARVLSEKRQGLVIEPREPLDSRPR